MFGLWPCNSSTPSHAPSGNKRCQQLITMLLTLGLLDTISMQGSDHVVAVAVGNATAGPQTRP